MIPVKVGVINGWKEIDAIKAAAGCEGIYQL